MFDLSALDTELDDLGRAPENASSLAESYAGIALSGPLSTVLEQVDAELSTLSNGEYQAPVRALSGLVPVEPLPVSPDPAPFAGEQRSEAFGAEPEREGDAFDPAPAQTFDSELPQSTEPAFSEPRTAADPDEESLTPLAGEQSGAFANPTQPRSASLTESQEIVLPDPVAREELSHESGELSLHGDDPESGSFALPDSPPEPDVSSDAPSARAPVTTEQLLAFDDVQDALEGSQPIAVSGRATHSPNAELDRDPDAEFDALLSEATDPRGIPTHDASGEIDADDLLRGLEGAEDGEPDSEDAAQDDVHEADLLTRSLYESGDDHTDVLDRATLGELERTAGGEPVRGAPESEDTDADLASLLSPDELDSGELEIIDDEPTPAPQATPSKADALTSMAVPPATARPGLSNKAPPPPPPSSNPEKRPSFLGRLFSKRDGE